MPPRFDRTLEDFLHVRIQELPIRIALHELLQMHDTAASRQIRKRWRRIAAVSQLEQRNVSFDADHGLSRTTFQGITDFFHVGLVNMSKKLTLIKYLW